VHLVCTDVESATTSVLGCGAGTCRGPGGPVLGQPKPEPVVAISAPWRVDLKFAGRFDRLRVINGMKERQVRASAQPDPPATVDAAWVEAVALRVVQLMHSGHVANDRGLVDAATLAGELGVDRSWVYAHRDALGVVRLGSGSKPRLRFDLQVARAALASACDEPAAIGNAGSVDPLPRKQLRSKRKPAVGRVLVVKARSS
jgi:hypothetical protein